jgi:hypothetical protein
MNSRVFALASLGQLDQAERLLRQPSNTDEEDAFSEFVAEANFGLIQLRRGEGETGCTHYRKAIEGFVRGGNSMGAASARAYFAREATMAKLSNAPKLVEEARASWKKAGVGHNHPALVDLERMEASEVLAAKPQLAN